MAGTNEAEKDDIFGTGALGCGYLAIILILIGIGNYQALGSLRKHSCSTAAWLGLSLITGFVRNSAPN